MPEIGKGAQSASPIARVGGGDISERELTRERYTLQTTPPARMQPANPKKQLFSAPVNKFTGKSPTSSNLARLQSCLDQYRSPATPVRPVKIGPKAVSMEDLTPNKRIKKDRLDKESVAEVSSPRFRSTAEEQAAVKIGQFMLVHAWRRRRSDVRCLRKTLEYQVSGSERLRIQVSALKSLLDSDNAKVRLAMRELERLKQLLHDKEAERAVLEREKYALEGDVVEAEDRASDMSIGWRNCRNELEGVRASAALSEHALALERVACQDAKQQRDRAYARLTLLEEELSQHEALLSEAEAEVSTLRREAEEKQLALQDTGDQLLMETEARKLLSHECDSLHHHLSMSAAENATLQKAAASLQTELCRARAELAVAREQLAWWPRPLTRMMGAARSLLRYPLSFPEAVIWSLVPARHGC